jgi:HAE1 family hydrophobic/amphiphilic exporter-1
VARVEFGAQDYATNSYLDGKPPSAWASSSGPGTNALERPRQVIDAMEAAKREFPPGARLPHRLQPHGVHPGIDQRGLQDLRGGGDPRRHRGDRLPAILAHGDHPIVAIPVSLIGTFAVMSALGFSLNNLTLFGLILAIGIVVDDAIVVVENVEREIANGLPPAEAAHKTMDEVGGALIAIALVLAAVFIPTAFIPGISGQFYRPVRAHHRGLDGDLGLQLADPLAGAGRAPAQAHDAHAGPSRNPFVRVGNWAANASTAASTRPPTATPGPSARSSRAAS